MIQSEDSLEVFPPFKRKDKVKKLPIFSNFEVTKDFEFDHVFINYMVETFSITTSLCNHCNDLRRHLMNPESYINE